VETTAQLRDRLNREIADRLTVAREPVRKSEQQKTICVDFDGVIADYGQGWQGPGKFGAPLPGAADSLEALRAAGWKVIIHTTRKESPGLRSYLQRHGIPYDEINQNSDQPPGSNPGKPIADVYLDDRAVRFESWPQAMGAIAGLRKSTGRVLLKAHVKEHMRREKSGAVTPVKAHEDRRQARRIKTFAGVDHDADIHEGKTGLRSVYTVRVSHIDSGAVVSTRKVKGLAEAETAARAMLAEADQGPRHTQKQKATRGATSAAVGGVLSKAWRRIAHPSLLLKSHIRTYIKKDGTVVHEHDDARHARKLQGLVEKSRAPSREQTGHIIRSVTKEEVDKIKAATGADVSNYRHAITDWDIRHIFKEHGNAKVEEAAGQIAITDEDIQRIPKVLAAPYRIGRATDTRGGSKAVVYEKRFSDGVIYYVAEIAGGGKLLRCKTMFKKKP